MEQHLTRLQRIPDVAAMSMTRHSAIGKLIRGSRLTVVRYVAPIVCAFLMGSAHAQPKTFVPYSEKSGIWYELPDGWEVVPTDETQRREQEFREIIAPKATQTELHSFDELPRLFAVHRPGNESGGALVGFRIDNIPPTDQLLQSEVRTFTELDRAILKQQLTISGHHIASRKAEFLGIRNSKLVAAEIINTGRLICFRLEFSGTHPTTGLTPRELLYDCPAGPVALIITVNYNRDLHDDFWPAIETLIASIVMT